MEGGGGGSQGRAALRRGISAFLNRGSAAGGRRWKLDVRPRGGRAEAFRAFENAIAHSPKDEVTILLVDSEGPVTAATPALHLRNRPGDGWNLAGVPEERVHLMVQTMETWIVADPETLAGWYGPEFPREQPSEGTGSGNRFQSPYRGRSRPRD